MKKIKTALISVFHKEGIGAIAKQLHENGVRIISTGGTSKYLQEREIPVVEVEDLSGYPAILGGRVKTLHPAVFGGILARREESHLAELREHQLEEIDLVIVDLYPFRQTIENSDDESAIIEKIDIGGIALIRAAAKNFNDLVVISQREQYEDFLHLLKEQNCSTILEQRRKYCISAFTHSSQYDLAIRNYFASMGVQIDQLQTRELRYGENPHQAAQFDGKLEEIFEQLNGKKVSYNNLVDLDSAWSLMSDFKDEKIACAILKHTNSCGFAIADTAVEAWQKALAGDPQSAFGGIIIFNDTVDEEAARAIDEIFYELCIAPSFTDQARDILSKKKKRVILKVKSWKQEDSQYKSILNGVIVQEKDNLLVPCEEYNVAGAIEPDNGEIDDMSFSIRLVKHLKSNAIVLAKNRQLLGMGCGQTSRVDALNQAIEKAERFGLDLSDACMASDAFFPFPDCVEIADRAGIKSVVQPGGSIKDQDSIDYCDAHGMTMVFTGKRHFKH